MDGGMKKFICIALFVTDQNDACYAGILFGIHLLKIICMVFLDFLQSYAKEHEYI